MHGVLLLEHSKGVENDGRRMQVGGSHSSANITPTKLQ